MSQQNGLIDMQALVRNAVLAQQMNRKRAGVPDLEGAPAQKLRKTSVPMETDCDEKVQEVNKSPESKRGGTKRRKEDVTYLVEPRIISIIKQPRTVVNHSYRDFSKVPSELRDDREDNIDDISFSEKVHDILSIAEYKPFISWMVHGRAFRVHIPKIFEERICPKYFGHSRYSSFLRLLNNHGFTHITQGADRNCYYHECFLRNMPHLCKYMPKPKNARHLTPDPDNEPDFYKLSRLYPLTDQDAVGEIEIPSSSFKKLAPAMPRDPPKPKPAARPKHAEVPAPVKHAKVPAPVKRSPVPVVIPVVVPVVAARAAPKPPAPVSSGTVGLPVMQATLQHHHLYQQLAAGAPLGGYTATSLLQRQRLMEQAAAFQEQANAIDNNALLNALRGSLNGGNFLGGGRFRF